MILDLSLSEMGKPAKVLTGINSSAIAATPTGLLTILVGSKNLLFLGLKPVLGRREIILPRPNLWVNLERMLLSFLFWNNYRGRNCYYGSDLLTNCCYGFNYWD